MDDFERELKVGFLEEASQLLGDTEQCFLSLESEPDNAALLDKIFRLAHNLKGSAKAVGFEQMGAFAHVFESFLLKVKNGEIPKSSSVISLLLRCNDFLKSSVEQLQQNLETNLDTGPLLAELEAGLNGQMQTELKATEPKPEDPSTSTTSLDSTAVEEEGPGAEDVAVLLAAETDRQIAELEASQEPSSAESKNEFAEPVPGPETKQPDQTHKSNTATSNQPAPTSGKVDESIRVSLSRLERLINIVGEMVIYQSVLREQVFGEDVHQMRRTVHQLGKVTKEVQDISMGLRMVPVKQTFQKMQRIVRDTATMLGKKVQLHLQGEETELDKTVLESIGDPLVHLIRNAVDHGIESAEKRATAGKPAEGTVKLSAFHESGKLIIEVSDDGGGIDGSVLLRKAKEKKILPDHLQMSEKDAVNLVFHPGFSTKQEVTEVSGRGVGMDVVKTNIESLQGDVQILTTVGKGTTFRITLPLTLAIIDGMVVRAGDERFVIPLSQVHESIRPEQKQVQFNSGLGETMTLRGETIPLVRLSNVLGRKPQKLASDSIAIVIRTTGKPFALLVDDIIGQFQIVIKKLGLELGKLKVFSGSAVLGDGKPAFILDPQEISKTYKPLPASPTIAANERITA